MYVYLCLLGCLDFSICCHHRDGGPGPSQRIHFCWTQFPFAQHVHRSSWINNKHSHLLDVEINSVPGASWEFHRVSRRSVQSQFSKFPLKRLLRIWILRHATNLDFFFQWSKWSFSTLFLRLFAGRLLIIIKSESAFFAIFASWFSFVIVTHGRMPKITWRIVACRSKCARNSDPFCRTLSSTVWSLHVIVCLRFWCRRGWLFVWTVGHRIGFPMLGARRELLAFLLSPWDSQRLPEAKVWRKVQDSPFEHNPLAFHWQHSTTLLPVKGLFPLWPFETAPLINMQLNTHSQSVIVSFSSAPNSFLIVQWQYCLKLRWILQFWLVQTFQNVVGWWITCG